MAPIFVLILIWYKCVCTFFFINYESVQKKQRKKIRQVQNNRSRDMRDWENHYHWWSKLKVITNGIYNLSLRNGTLHNFKWLFNKKSFWKILNTRNFNVQGTYHIYRVLVWVKSQKWQLKRNKESIK